MDVAQMDIEHYLIVQNKCKFCHWWDEDEGCKVDEDSIADPLPVERCAAFWDIRDGADLEE